MAFKTIMFILLQAPNIESSTDNSNFVGKTCQILLHFLVNMNKCNLSE